MNPLVEINATIMNTLIELLKTGGPMALWGLAIWLLLGLVRTVVLCLVIYLVIKQICLTIRETYKVSKELRDSKIHLLSQEVSKQFSDSLEDFQKNTERILKNLETALNTLSSKSEKK